MKITNILIILLITAVFTTAFYDYYYTLMTSYGETPTDLSTFNNTEKISNKTKAIYDKINATQTDNPSPLDQLLGAPRALLDAAFTAGMLLTEIPNLFQGLISDAVTIARFPTYVFAAFFGIILVLIMAGIIYFITSRVV